MSEIEQKMEVSKETKVSETKAEPTEANANVNTGNMESNNTNLSEPNADATTRKQEPNKNAIEDAKETINKHANESAKGSESESSTMTKDEALESVKNNESFLMTVSKKSIDIFAGSDSFEEEDYKYLASYLPIKVKELKKAPWIKSFGGKKNLDMALEEIGLSLAKDLLETKSTNEEYSANLENLSKVFHLSKKSMKSNMNTSQCIYYKCMEYGAAPLPQDEDLLPFQIMLMPLDSLNYEKEEGNKDAIKINLNLAQITAHSLGRIQIYFNAYIVVEIVRALCAKIGKPFAEILSNSEKFAGYYKLAKELNALHTNLKPNEFNKEVFKKYEKIFADKNLKKMPYMIELQKYLFYAQIKRDEISLHYLEKLLIQLLGHCSFEIRDKSIIYLNVLYDGIDWQFSAALEPKITCVKSEFVVDQVISSNVPLNYPFLLLSAPAFCCNCPSTVLSWCPVEIVSSNPNKSEYHIKVKFEKFWRAGFYDWKFMDVNPAGRIVMLQKHDAEGQITFAQGRFIVQPEEINEEQIHEVMVDYKDQDTDPDKNFLTLAADIPKYASEGINCLYLMGALERDNGITMSEETGELAEVKRPDASPLAITDLSAINKMLGGCKAYTKLMQVAKNYQIKIVVDCMARVSSTRPHKKYRKTLLHTLDEKDRLVLCYGADGRSVNYEDTAILNYRKLTSWNMIIDDTMKIVEKYKVNGIHLDNAQSWPVILERDEEELYRLDPDGTPAYTFKQILDGDIVRQCEGQGYWDSDSLVKYPNPIFIKLCRKFWSKYTDFLIIGECLGGSSFENRQGVLARSGIVPRLFKLPVALASIFGKKLLRTGEVIGCKPETVHVIKSWYENNRKFTPEGSYLIQSSSSHMWPYPALLYGRGAWSAVDALLFLPDIPMTFMDEINGHAYRKNITSIYQAKPLPRQYVSRPKSQLHLALEEQDEAPPEKKEEPVKRDNPVKSEFDELRSKRLERVRSMTSLSAVKSSAEVKQKGEEIKKQLGPQLGFDLTKINKLYEQRRKLRSSRPVLRYGKMIMLEAKHTGGTHPYVLAFARFSPSETAVIAINFTDRNVSFYIDLSNLLPLMQKHYPPNALTLFSDWLVDGDKEYYFLNELIHEKIPMTLKPFSSLCRGIVVCHDDPYAYAVALTSSAIRVSDKITQNIDCSSAQLCLQLNRSVMNFESLNDFAMDLTAIEKIYAEPNDLSFQKILLHNTNAPNAEIATGRSIEYCKRIVEYGDKNPEAAHTTAYKASKEIIGLNKLGPIVFVTPEIGRWSTVGGLGVMVDELTQGLAAINEDVYLIAVYYDKNRKGVSGYLATDPAGFKYVKVITVQTNESRYELGVHVGVVNKVKLIFLHNAGMFPSPYPDWNAAMTLRQIVVFCKGALEYLCSERLIPSVIVTNDWFTALTPAYAKYGAFGDAFKNTTFLHIFHNLQEGYEGRLYLSPADGDLYAIHGLDPGLLIDPHWRIRVINPSRCAILASDQWATVSKSYKEEILATSPLSPLLSKHPKPFAFQNGIPIQARLDKMKKEVGTDHYDAKRKLQQKYFKFQDLNDDVPVFAFVGRVTSQKGVHLICEAAEDLIKKYHGKINLLVGGPANRREPYAARCAGMMEDLSRRYPSSFWADPNEFFTDGSLVNLGADFGMMPSAFEPGGIVQHEFFVGGTPVIAYKTGGLKDSVFEYVWDKQQGNGFIFQSYNRGDFLYAMERALQLYTDKENYKILRKNAFASTMDGATVCREWCKEFYRLRQKLFGDICSEEVCKKIPIEWDFHKFKDSYLDEYLYRSFINPGNDKDIKSLMPLLEMAKKKNETRLAMFKIHLGNRRAKQVELSGSFDEWATKYKMNYDDMTNVWYVPMHLKKGKYAFKYIVDGNWICNDSENKERDKSGAVNNVMVIS